MTRKELIELGLDIEDAIVERQRLGEFDPNSKHMLLLLNGMAAMLAHVIDQTEIQLLPPPESK